jgi:glutamate dehydrogenase/leucine dehydrogenase
VSAYSGIGVLLQPQHVIEVVEEEYSCIVRSSSMKKVIHIVEENVFAAIGDGWQHDSCRWLLDTGALNHMLGCRAAFSSVDGGTIGTVRFANDQW